jgi:hypothetical protein
VPSYDLSGVPPTGGPPPVVRGTGEPASVRPGTGERTAVRPRTGDPAVGPGTGEPASTVAGAPFVGRAGNGGVPSDAATAMLDADPEELGDALGLAVISGLVDDVEVRSEPTGAVVRMSWPAGQVAG